MNFTGLKLQLIRRKVHTEKALGVQMLAVFVIERFKLRLFFGGKRDCLKFSITYFSWFVDCTDKCLKLSRMSLDALAVSQRGWERGLLLGSSETTQPRTPSCGGCAKIQRHLFCIFVKSLYLLRAQRA